MQQQMSKTLYKAIDEVALYYETVGGHIFLHLDLKTWGKDTLKKMRVELQEALIYFEDQGHDVVFMTTDEPKTVKMWETIKPLFNLQEVSKGGWLGSWITGDGRWD